MTLHQLIRTLIEKRRTWIYELDLDVRFEGEPISFEH
jgi:hypothetical protein